MKKLTPNDAVPGVLDVDGLADGARLALVGLAVKALMASDHELALEKLSAIADGAGHMSFVVKITATRTVMIGELYEGDSLTRLFAHVIETPSPARPEDMPSAFH